MTLTWYFVAAALAPSPSYIGPMTAEKCAAVERTVPDLGICRQAVAVMGCDVTGRPGIYTTCPVFAPLPSVTVKQTPQ